MNGVIELIEAGTTYHNDYGELVITTENLIEGINKFNSLPKNERRMVVKYGTHEPAADAAGWIVGLVGLPESAPKKVAAIVEWTKRGYEAVVNKLQRYISPEFAYEWVDNKTGEKGFAIIGAALLNDPHLTALGPAVALGESKRFMTLTPRDILFLSTGGFTMEMREKLCTMLGLEAAASDDDILNKLRDLQSEKSEIEVELSNVKNDSENKIKNLSATSTEAGNKIVELQAQLDSANKVAAEAREQKITLEAETEFAKLCASGRALPREREVCLAAYKRDPEGTLKSWELRGTVIELSNVTGISEQTPSSASEKASAIYAKAIASGKSPQEAYSEAIKIKN